MSHAATPRAGERLRPKDRIKKRADYRRIQLGGRRCHTRHFVIAYEESAREEGRLGITVTKRVGNAVTRNQIKRWVREAYRRHRTWFPPQTDVVFVAKRRAAQLTYPQLVDELRRVARSGKCVRECGE